MIKFALGIAIIAFTSFTGYVLAKKYRQRKEFFAQWQEFNERFLAEISYYRRPLNDFLSKYVYKGEFQEILYSFSVLIRKEGQRKQTMLQNALSLSEYSFLKNEERQRVEDYFLMLGKGDSVSQKAYFSSVRDLLKKLQNESKEQSKKYGDLYIKLGFLLGLLILILII